MSFKESLQSLYILFGCCLFYFKGDVRQNCDHDELLSQELRCQNNRTVLYLSDDSDQSYKYYVADINEANYRVRLIDTRENQKSNQQLKILRDSSIGLNRPLSFIDCAAHVASNHVAFHPQDIYTDALGTLTVCSSTSSSASSPFNKNYCPGQ
ncbi:hypothetical protein POM88_046090 [Heracleum sosnowskyi]|uniref:Uncharacterized protein n=1 Tax=Heracleum sosnowskyi TaxID=360622 RepID=A0AAD8H880_9APIA|nr:hypothetical protein POM88_046090 [Heracleum sosnowskyi]